MMANLVDVRIQDEVTDAHGSKNTTQVALGHQQNDPSLTYPHLSPLSSPQTHILPSKQMRQIATIRDLLAYLQASQINFEFGTWA